MATARTLTLNTKVNVTGADELNSLGKKLQATGRNLTVGLTLPLVALGGAVVAMAEEAARAEAKLVNTFDSMGAAAFTTVDALKATSKELQSITTFGDEEILNLQSTLLTFGNVTGDAFDRATKAALDMSAFFGTDLQTSAIQLGKALNNPIQGLTALTRVGVSFTEQQKDQIRALTESGDLLGAQTIILAELERQFGGTAETLAGTAGGQLKQALNALGDAGEEFGAIIAPVLVDVANAIKSFAGFLRDLNPEMKEWVVRIAAAAAVLGPLLIVVGSMVRALGSLGTGFSFLIKHIPGATVAMQKFSVATSGVLGPIGLLVGALTAAAFAYSDFINKTDSTSAAFLRLGNESSVAIHQISGTSVRLARELGISVDEVKERVVEAAETLGLSWEEAIARVAAGTDKLAIRHREAVVESGRQWETYQNQITAAGHGITSSIEELGDSVAPALADIQAAFTAAFGGELISSVNVDELTGEIAVQLQNGETIIGTSAESMMGAVGAAIERAEVDAVIKASGIPGALANALSENAGALQPALDTLIGIMDGSFDVMVDEAEIAAAQAALAQAEAYEFATPQAAAAARDQMAVIQNILDEAAIQAKITAGLSGTATIEEQAKAMALSAWLVEQEALGIVNLQTDQWERAIEIAREKGYDTPAEFAAAMQEANALVSAAADAVSQAATGPLSGVADSAYGWGSGIGYSLANGIYSVVPVVRTAAGTLANAVRGQVGILSEPKDPDSPLRGITKWGANLAETFAEGILREVPAVRSASLALAGAAAPGLATSLPNTGTISPGVGGGTVINNFYLQWEGEPPQGRTEQEIISTLQRLLPMLSGQLTGI